MTGDENEGISKERLHQIVKCQGVVGRAMAEHIASITGASVRRVIAASALTGVYDTNFKERPTDAQARFCLPRTSTFSFDDKALKIIRFSVLLLIAGLLLRCVTLPSDTATSDGGNSSYARCEADLKPKLEKCLEGPQSVWGACRAAYLDELESCTGK